MAALSFRLLEIATLSVASTIAPGTVVCSSIAVNLLADGDMIARIAGPRVYIEEHGRYVRI